MKPLCGLCLLVLLTCWALGPLRYGVSLGSLGFKARTGKRTLMQWGGEDTVTPDDLLEFGFIPEFVGRMPVLVQLHPLGKEGLIRVLTEPKNAVVKQYQNMFGLDGVDLQFTPEALKATAEEALNQKTKGEYK